MTYIRQAVPKKTTTSSSQIAFIVAALALASPSASLAKPENFIMDTSQVGQTNHGVVSSDQFLELGVSSANALRLEGEQALRMGTLDRAITVLQRSVEMAPLDMDGRILYAEALEKKLLKEKEKDPVLFNFTVKQWLFVFKKSEFPDQAYQGLQHVNMLTGTIPKRFEKPEKFLTRVLLPEDGSTKVALGDKDHEKSLKDKDDKDKDDKEKDEFKLKDDAKDKDGMKE